MDLIYGNVIIILIYVSIMHTAFSSNGDNKEDRVYVPSSWAESDWPKLYYIIMALKYYSCRSFKVP